VIVETLLSNYVQTASHVTSTAVQLAVALVLGFSINAIHKRVEHFVDRVLFRARHAAQAALHAFSLDAAYITEGSLLLERCVHVVRQNVRATSAAILLHDSSDDYIMAAGDFSESVRVDPNDPVVLAMRARHVVVDLPLAGSALPGVIAFPLVSSGELIGILVCAGKADLETYAPDERASLAEVAAAVAHALRTLRIKDLEREVSALRLYAVPQP
jgi:GAF domain-containing protein